MKPIHISGSKIISDPNKIVAQLQRLTEAFLKHTDSPYVREVECVRLQYPLWMERISPGDLFAGKGEYDQAFGFSPQPGCSSLGWFYNRDAATWLLAHPEVTPSNKELLRGLITFWEEADTANRIRQAYPPEMAIKEPHNYQHLTLRVGGYSARFVDLPKDVQSEVLSRTLY